MSQPLIVAIDGPSGSGKSTVAKMVAGRLKAGYLDTGATYRAATWWCLEEKIDLSDENAAAAAVREMPLNISLEAQNQYVKIGETDLTSIIRTPEITRQVSTIATMLPVRAALLELQRSLVLKALDAYAGVVLEGRDVTSVVTPEALVKVILTASEQARLQRRSLEVRGSDSQQALADTRDEIVARDQADATVSEFMHATGDTVEIDSTSLTAEEVSEQILQLVEKAREDERTAAALLAGLADFDLDADDQALLAGDGFDFTEDEEAAGLPVLAIIGRPNVGKSTLVNRILGRRAAVVQDTPGVTRDRVSYQAEWAGRRFTLVDTGGWEQDVAGLDAAVAQQAEFAIEQSDAVLFVVDGTVGITNTDEELVKILRRCGRPIILAVNKIDSAMQEAEAAYFWSLGLGEPYAISALHGRGTGDALDAMLKVLPEVSAVAKAHPTSGPRRIALVGRPNVGKSSLLNKLAGQERVVVNELAGTTRDPVDEVITLDGRPWVFVDTAGIRRRVHQTRGADFYASLRTQAAIEKAELGLVLIDASQPLTEQDVRVIQQVIDAGRALVIAANKWDLVDEERQAQLKRELGKDLVQVQWAPQFNVSAKTGWHTNRLVRAVEKSLQGWDTRISTGKLNAFLGELVAAHPHPVRGGKQPRILFATQASNRPPRFIIFATGFLEAPYRRFLENRLRENFCFEGTPIEISVRVRQKRRK